MPFCIGPGLGASFRVPPRPTLRSPATPGQSIGAVELRNHTDSTGTRHALDGT